MENDHWKYLLETVMNGETLEATEHADIIEYLSMTTNSARVAAMVTALMIHYYHQTN